MSTSAIIQFTDNDGDEAYIYRHSDGYPDSDDGVLADLQKFFRAVKEQTSDTRFNQPSYLAAKFVVWQAGQNSVPGSLAFLSVGIVSKETGWGEYIYTVNCAKMDKNKFPTVTYKEA
jgi:hypothetical protein